MKKIEDVLAVGDEVRFPESLRWSEEAGISDRLDKPEARVLRRSAGVAHVVRTTATLSATATPSSRRINYAQLKGFSPRDLIHEIVKESFDVHVRLSCYSVEILILWEYMA